ncbi:hypothetical protein [Bacteroides gallinarum]|uniref:hypothetical protein n=1 Tax=Bacteroides gallinarum TaxID=376806 RepID=UPI000370C670|nr:hypothetical protein [Bacteroides gallinarum]
MGKLIKGIKIAAYLAEIIIASSVVIELVEKYGGRYRRKSAAGKKVDAGDTTTEN